MKLLGITKSKITKDNNDENIPHLEITEVALVHFNFLTAIINIILHTFVPNKSSGQLVDISPRNFIFLKAFDSEFSNNGV